MMRLRTVAAFAAGLTAFALSAAAVSACGSASNESGFDASPTNADGSASGADGGGISFGTGPGSEGGSGGCVGLQCQQTTCDNGGDTTVTGTVYAPNGTMPLYDVIVYVPNAPVLPLTQGVTCDQCGTVASGNPVVSTLSNPDGTFKLTNVPVGQNIPLVMQLGKWRRQITIASVDKCTETKLTDPQQTRLPKNQTEGNMPHIALTTGGFDNLGCMLPKVGIDPAEFGSGTDGFAKAVNVFKASGGQAGATSATAFWDDLPTLKNYDLVLLSCEGSEEITGEPGSTKDATSFKAISDYLTGGGRIFTTDFMYTWYKDSPDTGIKSVSTIPGGAPIEGDYSNIGTGDPLTIDTTFPKGLALSQWLLVNFPNSADIKNSQVTMDIVFGNISTTDATKAQVWARSKNDQGGSTMYPRVQTVNIPVGVPTAMQCGKGVHIDAHVDSPGAPNSDTVTSAYPSGCTHPLSEGEAMLAFFFFDLASCIQNDSQPPPPPGVK